MKRVSRILSVLHTTFSSDSSPSPSDDKDNKQGFVHELSTPLNASLIPKPTYPSPEEILTLANIKSDDPCLVCSNPCSTHAPYPNLKFDRNSELEGTVKEYFKHVVISTGKSDWASKIDEESGSLAEQLNINIKKSDKRKENKKEKKKGESNVLDGTNELNVIATDTDKQSKKEDFKLPRVILTNSSRFNTDDDSFSNGNDILLFPDNILVRKVLSKDVPEFCKKFLSPTPYDQIEQYDNDQNFEIEQMPYKAVILICSHKRRDKRCGVTAPLLKTEFEAVLKDRGLDLTNRSTNGVGVFMVSHIGGHKFAGNVIVYRDGQGIWYGRVNPCHAKVIVEKTVIEGKVIKDLYRGSMNGSFGEGKGGKLEW